MSLTRDISRAIRSTLVLWILTAVLYPFAMLSFGQIAFSNQANGSLIRNAGGTVIGSALIGQPFESDRYFNSRPSTTSYSTADPNNDANSILKTGVSGASNYAPSNPELQKRVQSEVERLKQAGIQPTADLVYTSGSSLDPHISVEAARAQVARISRVRNIEANKLELLITQHTEGRFLGIFGEPGVNVLRLNLALDQSNA
ncbi:K(+)-transporting ATPase subunit C [Myxacorys almedinensis]|uniref:Potassium-transporting ATPase KdpC subunit n=1 Tax=Myxacorys almedinensis A TaxID=2690445 RepID=A0A8J7Z6F4_9CYAN|nr:K(+)-transporting ATPase subunit C [Myxacorys almedinensis]NDJ19021.1 K(+)-transporting ATPase subunit C [Myxacorys almedinensis A]